MCSSDLPSRRNDDSSTPRRTEPSPTAFVSWERKWKGVGGRKTERRLQKRANCPAGRNRQRGRVVREMRQPLHVHERLCRTFLVPRPNTPFPSGFPEPNSILHASGSSPVRILSCRLHRSDLTKTARPLESSCCGLAASPTTCRAFHRREHSVPVRAPV